MRGIKTIFVSAFYAKNFMKIDGEIIIIINKKCFNMKYTRKHFSAEILVTRDCTVPFSYDKNHCHQQYYKM